MIDNKQRDNRVTEEDATAVTMLIHFILWHSKWVLRFGLTGLVLWLISLGAKWQVITFMTYGALTVAGGLVVMLVVWSLLLNFYLWSLRHQPEEDGNDRE